MSSNIKYKIRKISMREYNVVSFFSGCGGFDYGFHKNNFNIIFGNDVWKDASESFKSNYPKSDFFQCNIEDITDNDIKKSLKNKKIDVIIGGPPCQCFTRLNNRQLIKLSEQKKEDKRRVLSQEYIKKVSLIKPKVVLMENVRDLLVRKNQNGRLYSKIIEREFAKIGYKVYHKIIEMDKYGIPQRRKRVIFLATNDEDLILYFKNNPDKIFPLETNQITTVSSVLKKFKPNKKVLNHIITENDKETLLRIKNIPQGGYYEHLPNELKTKKIREGKEVIVKRYGSYFRRLHPDKPSTTITNNYIIHPTEDRYLSNREKALIHTFPMNFRFKGTEVSVSQQIANAVPPKFSEILAIHIKNLLKISK